MKKLIEYLTKIADFLAKLAELLKLFRKNPSEKTAKRIKSLKKKIRNHRRKRD